MTNAQERKIKFIKEQVELAIQLQDLGFVAEIKNFEVNDLYGDVKQVVIEVGQEGKEYSYFNTTAQIFIGKRGGFTANVYTRSTNRKKIKNMSSVLIFLGLR